METYIYFIVPVDTKSPYKRSLPVTSHQAVRMAEDV